MSPVFDTFLADDSIVATDVLGGPDGDLRLYPDLDELVPLAGQPGWAWAPVDRITQDGATHPACTRTLLRHLVSAAAADGVTVRASVEIEFALALPGGTAFEPACRGPAYGMTRLVEQSEFSADLLRALGGRGRRGRPVPPRVRGRAVRGLGRRAQPGRRRRPQRARPADDPRGGAAARAAGVVRAGGAGRWRRQRWPPAPVGLAGRAQPARRRRRPVRDDRGGRGAAGRDRRAAAGAGRAAHPEPVELPADAAVALGRRVRGLGPREPGGRGPGRSPARSGTRIGPRTSR